MTTESWETECTEIIETTAEPLSPTVLCFGLVHRTSAGLKRCQEKMKQINADNSTPRPSLSRFSPIDSTTKNLDVSQTTESFDTECTEVTETPTPEIQSDKTKKPLEVSTESWETECTEITETTAEPLGPTVLCFGLVHRTSAGLKRCREKMKQVNADNSTPRPSLSPTESTVKNLDTTESFETECTEVTETPTPEILSDKTKKTIEVSTESWETECTEVTETLTLEHKVEHSEITMATLTVLTTPKIPPDETTKSLEMTTESWETECTEIIETTAEPLSPTVLCFGLVHRTSAGLKRCQEKMKQIHADNSTPRPSLSRFSPIDSTTKNLDVSQTTESFETECTEVTETPTPEIQSDKTKKLIEVSTESWETECTEITDITAGHQSSATPGKIDASGTLGPLITKETDNVQSDKTEVLVTNRHTEETKTTTAFPSPTRPCFGLVHRTSTGLTRCLQKMKRLNEGKTTPRVRSFSTVENVTPQTTIQPTTVIQYTKDQTKITNKVVDEDQKQFDYFNKHFYYFNGMLKKVSNHGLKSETPPTEKLKSLKPDKTHELGKTARSEMAAVMDKPQETLLEPQHVVETKTTAAPLRLHASSTMHKSMKKQPELTPHLTSLNHREHRADDTAEYKGHFYYFNGRSKRINNHATG
ncbi:hypothetical protein SRHO_G00234580 [Serrasalmus rhombeus]